MRLDHIAYRAKDRHKTAQFFQDCLGYTVGTEFNLEFDDGSTTECIALAPPEDRSEDTSFWKLNFTVNHEKFENHAPCELFVSDGPPGSIVGDWVAERGDIGGVHHIAYEVDDVAAKMKDWKEKGYAEFYSEEPLVCEETGLVQVFSKPSELTGVIYELIKRGKTNQGFCERNVKALMESTKG
jgi:catechol 2,3-dioxygenase-like lactoylglutathione lyase family enzyme